MTKTRFAVASLLLMILHSPLAHADDALPPPIVFVSTFLQLAPAQTQALIAAIQARDAALQPIAMKLHADQESLGRLVESSDADPATAGRLLLEIRAAEKQASAVVQAAAAQFEAVLTPEQRGRLQFVRQAAQIEPAIPAFKAVGLM
jgi:Spy/CpxP family protein refolding chaperone